jgi:hypothetical protein
MNKKINFLFLFLTLSSFAQTSWKSKKYNYKIEIPKEFTISESTGINVDFKANKGKNSVVIVIKKFPKKYENNSIWEILGNLETYGKDWELGAKEYMNSPKFIKYGKTTINGNQAFWYDYTTENPKFYSKTYQVKKGSVLYTFTLTCEFTNASQYSAVWYRFKEKIEL